MGLLALAAAFLVGTTLVDISVKEILAGFPGDLVVILVGVTFVFAIAERNGAIEWVVHGLTRLFGHRAVAMPWVVFIASALLTSFGALGPAAVAIVGARRASLCRPAPDQSLDDGPDDDPRRAGRGLFADLRLRRDYERRRCDQRRRARAAHAVFRESVLQSRCRDPAFSCPRRSAPASRRPRSPSCARECVAGDGARTAADAADACRDGGRDHRAQSRHRRRQHGRCRAARRRRALLAKRRDRSRGLAHRPLDRRRRNLCRAPPARRHGQRGG